MISFRLSKKEIKKVNTVYVCGFARRCWTYASRGSAQESKNLGIIAITLATRYAIEGNLPPDIAFAHSILYIQTLEQLDNVESVKRLSGTLYVPLQIVWKNTMQKKVFLRGYYMYKTY